MQDEVVRATARELMSTVREILMLNPMLQNSMYGTSPPLSSFLVVVVIVSLSLSLSLSLCVCVSAFRLYTSLTLFHHQQHHHHRHRHRHRHYLPFLSPRRLVGAAT